MCNEQVILDNYVSRKTIQFITADKMLIILISNYTNIISVQREKEIKTIGKCMYCTLMGSWDTPAYRTTSTVELTNNWIGIAP